MASIDPYAATDKLDAALLEVIVTRLEARGKHPAFARMLQDYFDAMRIDGGRTVLDLGCGTGVAARAIARRPGFAGRVDRHRLSAALVETAVRLAERRRFGGSHRLPGGRYPQPRSRRRRIRRRGRAHAAEPRGRIRSRSCTRWPGWLRPGGMLGIFDGDYASFTFGHDDPSRAEPMTRR